MRRLRLPLRFRNRARGDGAYCEKVLECRTNRACHRLFFRAETVTGPPRPVCFFAGDGVE